MKTKKPKSGWYWHVHHDQLIEFCYNYEERRDFIIANKPYVEQKLRLKLFQPSRGFKKSIKGAEWWKADAERRKVEAEWRKADAEWRKVYAERRKVDAEWRKANAEWRKVEAEREKAEAEWYKAEAEWQKLLDKNAIAVLALHEKECKNCPWKQDDSLGPLMGNIF